jgi:hypothetical protein
MAAVPRDLPPARPSRWLTTAPTKRITPSTPPSVQRVTAVKGRPTRISCTLEAD